MKLSRKKIKSTLGKTNLSRICTAIFAASVLFAVSCTDRTQSSSTDTAPIAGTVTAGQIIGNPAAYVGRTVTVTGEVERIWGPRAFNLDSGLTAGELLVLGREAYPNVPERGNTGYMVKDTATVTGVVRMLVTAETEREIGWDLDPQIETEFNARPVLIAQSVAFRAGAAANTNTAAAGEEITDVLIIVDTPDRPTLVGRRVRFTNVSVQDVVGDRTFYIGPNANRRILVALEEEPSPNRPIEGKVNVNPGQTVSFTGTVVAMPSAEEARTRFGRLLNESEFNNIAKQQIYIRTDRVNIAGKGNTNMNANK